MNMRCELCQKEFKSINGLQIHLKQIHKLKELESYYLKYINDSDDQYCEICGNRKKFNGFAHGYMKTCGNKSCRGKYSNIHGKQKQIDGCKKRNEKWKSEIIDGKTKQQLIVGKGALKRQKKQKVTSQKISESLKLVDNNGLTMHQKTCMIKYGISNVMQLEDVKNKLRDTFKNKYGVEWITQSEEIKTKISNTMIKKYGVSNYTQTNEYKANNTLINKEKMYFRIKQYMISNNLTLITELKDIYENEKTVIEFKCDKCNNHYKKCWNDIQSWWVCRKCNPYSRSSYEIDLCQWLDSHNIKYESQYTELKNPDTGRSLELDIFIPSMNIAIEFDGLYWHSNLHQLNDHYHLMKTELATEYNIRLLHIFEDEWILNQDIVKSRLSSILNIKNTTIIYARKCKIKEVEFKDKKKFLNDNHLQGNDVSKINLGLYYNDNLVSIMTFSKANIAKGGTPKNGEYELSRFCNLINYHIPGSASKLLSYFKRNYQWDTIFSYADRRWSDGHLYNTLGFKFKHMTPPSQWYINKSNIIHRIHRFQLRKSQLKHLDSYDESLSANKILELSEYIWIYDCGNYKFIMKNTGKSRGENPESN